MKQTLLIRADANTEIGTGHVMRCLALAQAWQDSGRRAVFAMGTEAPALSDRLTSEGVEVFHILAEPGSMGDAEQTTDLAQKMSSDWVVVDGYHFGSKYQRVIKESGSRFLFIDDYGHADHYYADIVLNQNLHANEGLYRSREPYTKLLLGTQYVLLRREFWSWRGWKREIPKVARNVLVTLGGSDPDNVTLKVIQAMQQIETLDTVVVIGGANPHYEELLSVVEGDQSIRLEKNAKNMSELMACADLAVSAGGSTCWEFAFMNLPNIVLVLFDNQYPIVESLKNREIIINLGWHKNVYPGEIAQSLKQLSTMSKSREKMAYNGKTLVDGNGSKRVARKLIDN